MQKLNRKQNWCRSWDDPQVSFQGNESQEIALVSNSMMKAFSGHEVTIGRYISRRVQIRCDRLFSIAKSLQPSGFVGQG
jgi:hypothetical protein